MLLFFKKTFFPIAFILLAGSLDHLYSMDTLENHTTLNDVLTHISKLKKEKKEEHVKEFIAEIRPYHIHCFIENKSDINTTNSKDDTLLNYAIFYNDKNQNDILIEFLIDNKANINAQNCLGNTPLHLTAYYHPEKNEKITHLLLEKKANPDIENKSKNSALHVTFYDDLRKNFQNNKLLEKVRTHLIMSKADVLLKNNNNTTPIELAIDENGDQKYSTIVKLMLNEQNYSTVYKKFIECNQIEIIEYCNDHCFDFSIKNTEGKTILDYVNDQIDFFSKRETNNKQHLIELYKNKIIHYNTLKNTILKLPNKVDELKRRIRTFKILNTICAREHKDKRLKIPKPILLMIFQYSKIPPHTINTKKMVFNEPKQYRN